MSFSEVVFHGAVFLWNNLHFILLPLSAVLAWQDFKKLTVNSSLVYLTRTIFCLGFAHANTISITFCIITLAILMLYKKFRPISIQTIDIEFFSLGVLWLDSNVISTYSFLVAFFLVLFRALLKQRRLPFLTAWFIGFWAVFLNQSQFCCN